MQAWMEKRTPRAWARQLTLEVLGVVRLIGLTNSPRHGVTGQVLGLAFLQSCSSLVYVFLLQCSCHDHQHGRRGTGAGDV